MGCITMYRFILLGRPLSWTARVGTPITDSVEERFGTFAMWIGLTPAKQRPWLNGWREATFRLMGHTRNKSDSRWLEYVLSVALRGLRSGRRCMDDSFIAITRERCTRCGKDRPRSPERIVSSVRVKWEYSPDAFL